MPMNAKPRTLGNQWIFGSLVHPTMKKPIGNVMDPIIIGGRRISG